MGIRKFNQQDIQPALNLAEKLKMFDDTGMTTLKGSMEQAIQTDNCELWFVAVDEEKHKVLKGVIYACPRTYDQWCLEYADVTGGAGMSA